MTNLDIIKYLATNNPTRLAELLDDIYCCAWNSGAYAANTDGARFSSNEIDDFNWWINQETNTNFFYNSELEGWSKVIDKKDLDEAPTINLHEWISVNDRLPEKFVHVLCVYPSKDYGSNIVVDYMESDRGYFAEQFKYGPPTYWMPLPELPVEKEN